MDFFSFSFFFLLRQQHPRFLFSFFFPSSEARIIVVMCSRHASTTRALRRATRDTLCTFRVFSNPWGRGRSYARTGDARRRAPGSCSFRHFSLERIYLLTYFLLLRHRPPKKNAGGEGKEQPDKWTAWEEKKFFSALKVRLRPHVSRDIIHPYFVPPPVHLATRLGASHPQSPRRLTDSPPTRLPRKKKGKEKPFPRTPHVSVSSLTRPLPSRPSKYQIPTTGLRLGLWQDRRRHRDSRQGSGEGVL